MRSTTEPSRAQPVDSGLTAGGEVVVVGLGPAGPEFTTAAAVAALTDAPVCYLRTARHPAAAPFVAAGVPTFDQVYEESATFDETYRAIVEVLVSAALEHGRVVYGVPGSPSVLERTVSDLRADNRVVVKTVPGLSFLDLAWDRLGVDPVSLAVRLVDAERFAVDAAGDAGPLLVSHAWSNQILSDVKLSCEAPDGTNVVLLHHLGCDDEQVVEVDWSDLDRTISADHLTCLYIPSLPAPPAAQLARADEVVRILRAKCPWDAEQTHRSLVRHLLEETYEAIEAIEELGDPPDLEASEHLEEELGDVLCQVLFHSTIAEEEGLFTLGDVAGSLADKLVRRHPHVFGPATSSPATSSATNSGATKSDPTTSGDEASGNEAMNDVMPDAEQVLARWEQQKQAEKGRDSLLDGIPRALPALAYAAKLEKKVATVGLGLPTTVPEVRRSLSQQLDALLAGDREAFGPVLFDLARLAVVAGVDPEEVLRHAAAAFRIRFVDAERLARDAGTTLTDATDAERLGFWSDSVG